jgi:hypothetical protein
MKKAALPLAGLALCALLIIAGQISAAESEESRADELPGYLEAADGRQVPISIHKEMELQRIPFTVEYSIPSCPAQIVRFEWEVTQPPPGRHYKEFPVFTELTTSGDKALLTLYSNRPEYLVTLTAIDDEGTAFHWTDTVRNEMLVNDSITLSTHGVPTNGDWRQVRAGNISMFYTTGNAVALSSGGTTTSFVPTWPGNYWFERDAGSDDAILLEVFVSMKTDRYLPMRGICMADLYGPYPLGNLDDEVEGAVAYVESLGASAVWILDLATSLQIYPTPMFLSESGGSIAMPTLRAVATACNEKSIDTFLLLGIPAFVSHYIPPTELESLWQPELKSEAWYSRFFEELRSFAMHHIRMTQGSGIDGIIPKYRHIPFYQGDVFQAYALDTQCWDLLSDLKVAFDGQVGWSDPDLSNPEHTRFLADAEFVVLPLRPETFVRQGAFSVPSQPTVTEIRTTVRDHLDGIYAALPPGIPVYIEVGIHGADGQGDEEGYGATDWPEQIDYAEGFLQAAYQTDWIDGIVFQVANWFDWNLQTISEGGGTSTPWGVNIRGVPIEEAIRIWFDILGGSS